MDVVAKEVFFQENILFLEGQEDVGLLKPELRCSEINIFGYGVRGYNAFDFALQLAADLGIKKAAVILDSPTQGAGAGQNENITMEELQVKYGHYGYEIFQWNKYDIRDKAAFTTFEKSGYFDALGKIKPDDQLDDFRAKLSLVRDYFGITDGEPGIPTVVMVIEE